MGEGEILAFIGPNGAEKSTLIRTLMGLLRKSAGEAEVLGKGVEASQVHILEQVGYLPAESHFYPKLKVQEIIDFASKVRKLEDKQYAYELAEALHLDVKRRTSQLSLGNRKKLGIVLALMHKPRLLILDEPTSGLDPYVQQIFWQYILRHKEQRASIFLSSHVLSEVEHFCDRIAFIKDGMIIQESTIAELRQHFPRKVLLVGQEEAPAVAGVSEVKQTMQGVEFYYILTL